MGTCEPWVRSSHSPRKREEQAVVTDERRAAFITGLCALTFLLGFFIAGPMLALFAFSYTTTAHPLPALSCVAGLLVVWAITRLPTSALASESSLDGRACVARRGRGAAALGRPRK